MFDFEKLDVYKKAKLFNADIRKFIKATKLDGSTNDNQAEALSKILFAMIKNLR